MKKINLGFVITFSKDSWLGGNIYLSNLINQIKKKSKDINPIIITNINKTNENFKEFRNIKILKSKLFSNDKKTRIINKFKIMLFGKDLKIEEFLNKNDIHILSHFFITGRNSLVKSLFWIPDFQELKNLKYISFRRKLLRRLSLLFAIKNSSKIILSSNTVKKDLQKINFKASKNSVVFKPFFETPNSVKNLNILKKYGIKKFFFLLPNQYWKHKNHQLILSILKDLVSRKKIDFQVISTGYFNDYRYPNYKFEIQDFINKYKLKNYYKILGVIPYNDLMDLMHYSIAVINPSKSEGWSSTVEQAKSMGKMVLLSNLKVHKEQLPYRHFYFKINEKDKLKEKMLNLSNDFIYKNEKKKMKIAKKKMKKIKKKFINQYIDYIYKINNE